MEVGMEKRNKTMGERPEKALEWLRNVGVNGYWTHPDPPITVFDQAKAQRNEILKELLEYITQLEASLAEARAEAKKFKVISGVVGSEISRKLDQIKHWLEEVDKLEEQDHE